MCRIWVISFVFSANNVNWLALNQILSNPAEIFFGDSGCLLTYNPSLRIKSSAKSVFRHTLLSNDHEFIECFVSECIYGS